MVYGYVHVFLLAALGAVLGVVAAAGVIEVLIMRHLYDRDHLGQLLATFGLLLFIDEMATVIWREAGALQMHRPDWLHGVVEFSPAFPIRALDWPSRSWVSLWRWRSIMAATTRGSACSSAPERATSAF